MALCRNYRASTKGSRIFPDPCSLTPDQKAARFKYETEAQKISFIIIRHYDDGGVWSER